jgi:hypothetical protein
MFGFFINDEFKGFWSNSAGDRFFQATCKSLGWAESQVTLVYYPNLKQSELQNCEPLKSDCKVYKKVQTEITVTELDEDGNEVTRTEIQDELVLDRVINADTFVLNGLILIPC